MQVVTLLFLIQENQVLLALKKRGVGEGKWNGVGGKVMAEESIEAATLRECEEEIGVRPKDMEKVAEIEFSIPSRQFHNIAHVYMARDWEGEIIETEEMRPAWYELDAIPYDEMWSDDILWLPKVLAGEKIRAFFLFDETDKVARHTIEPLSGANQETGQG